MSSTRPRALVAYESMFDNTARIAEAVTWGLRSIGFEAYCVPVCSLAATGPSPVDLVVLGAPTPSFSLSRRSTRADAVRQGAPPERAGAGAREWIAAVRPESFSTKKIAVFDTRVGRVRRFPFAAGLTAARLLRRRGFEVVGGPAAFLVENTPGPLTDGELDRAEAWGRTIGAAVCSDELDHPVLTC